MGDFFRGQIKKAEFKNPLSTSTVIKWKTGMCVLYFFIFIFNFLSFEMSFFLEPLFQTKRHDNIFLPTHLKRQIDFLCDKMVMDVTHR